MGEETQLLLNYCQDIVITTTAAATNVSIIIGYDFDYYFYCSSLCSYFVGFTYYYWYYEYYHYYCCCWYISLILSGWTAAAHTLAPG